MAEFAFDLDGLSPWQREQAARHYQQTFDMRYGCLERMTENFFRQPPGSCPDQSPVAGALRELPAQVRSGKPVRVRLAGFSKQDKYQLSELLRQSAARPYRDGNEELGQALGRLARQFDAEHRLTADELDRDEFLRLDSDRREADLARREAARLKRSRVA